MGKAAEQHGRDNNGDYSVEITARSWGDTLQRRPPLSTEESTCAPYIQKSPHADFANFSSQWESYWGHVASCLARRLRPPSSHPCRLVEFFRHTHTPVTAGLPEFGGGKLHRTQRSTSRPPSRLRTFSPVLGPISSLLYLHFGAVAAVVEMDPGHVEKY